METKILELLTTKFEGVSENVLSGIAKKIAKTAKNEDEATSAVEELTFQNILEQYADQRATAASLTAVKNYEKKFGIKDGKKIEKDNDSENKQVELNENKDDVKELLKAILEQQKTLGGRIATLEGDKISSSRKTQLDNLLSGLPESYKKAYSRLQYKDLSDDDFSAMLTEIGSEVEGIKKSENARGAAFKPPFTGSGDNPKKATDKEIDEVVNLLNV